MVEKIVVGGGGEVAEVPDGITVVSDAVFEAEALVVLVKTIVVGGGGEDMEVPIGVIVVSDAMPGSVAFGEAPQGPSSLTTIVKLPCAREQ